MHPCGQVTHPDRVQLVLGENESVLIVEHLLGECRGTSGIRPGSRYGRGKQHGLGVVDLRVAKLDDPLLDLVQLGQRSQLPDVPPDVVGNIILERHQRSALSLIANQCRPVIITLGAADEWEFRIDR